MHPEETPPGRLKLGTPTARHPYLGLRIALPHEFVAAVYDCRIGAPHGTHRDAATATARQRARAYRVGAPPLTHLRGVLAKPETRSAEAGAAIASRRNAAGAAETWDADGAASLGLRIALPRGFVATVYDCQIGAPRRSQRRRYSNRKTGRYS
ncbi:MAG: hypothetical protein NTZ08_04605 [Verrucomicrobia bacterium]|nr:hypothetical protein [Verrucomicrobiota bacterium]